MEHEQETPQAAVRVAAAAASITARIGPMHSVKPAVKATPTPHAPPGPRGSLAMSNRRSRIRRGIRTDPIMDTPKTTIPRPITRTMVGSSRKTRDPKKADATPRVVKTTAKLATNARDARGVVVQASRLLREEVGSADV